MPKKFCDECAASPTAYALIELGNELVVNINVQTHVSILAHWIARLRSIPC